MKPTLAFNDATPVTGKTVTWTSSAPTVATVNSTGLVTAVSAGTTTITAAVDGRSATASITVRPPAVTTLNNAAQTSATIGPNGGVLTTSASGVTYRLEIPKGALAINTLIRMTPVVTIGNFALSGGLVGAVDLQPSGTKFARPATLRIGVAAPPRAGLALAGFSMNDNGAKTARELASARANEVVVSVSHFTAAGAGFGTTQEVESMSPTGTRLPAAQQFADAFVATVNGSRSAPALVAALVGWFDVGVLPQLQNAATDSDLLSAVAEYEMWATDVFVMFGTLPISSNDPSLQVRQLQWRNALSPKLLTAVQQNNQTCRTERSTSALLNTLFWQTVAQTYGIATGALSRSSVLGQLCVQVVVEGANFPDPVQSGFPNDLDVRFAMQFGNDPRLAPQQMTIEFSSSSATFSQTSPANSDAIGEFTVAVTVQGNTQFAITVFGCLGFPGASDVCGLHAVNGTSLDLTGSYTGRFSSRIQTTGGVTVPINVPVNVKLTQNQNGISGTYEVMEFNGPRGNVSATLVGQELLNFTLSQFAPCVGTLSGTAMVTVATRAIQSNYTGSDCTGTHSNGVSDIAPGTTALKDFNGAWGDAINTDGFPNAMIKVRQAGTQVFLMFSTYNAQRKAMDCRARFQGNVSAGSELFTATLTGNLNPFDDFVAGSRIAWAPHPNAPRAAIVTITNASALPPFSMGLLGNVPQGCNP